MIEIIAGLGFGMGLAAVVLAVVAIAKYGDMKAFLESYEPVEQSQPITIEQQPMKQLARIVSEPATTEEQPARGWLQSGVTAVKQFNSHLKDGRKCGQQHQPQPEPQQPQEPTVHETVAEQPPKQHIPTTDNRTIVYETVLQAEQPTTFKEIVSRCGLNKGTTWRALVKLEADGRIEKQGGLWHVSRASE